MIGQINKEYIQKRPTKFFSRMVSYALFEGRPVTTPGQWINPLVFKLLNFAQKRNSKQVKQPIFILGTGRSGTTILGIVLSMHSDIAFLNEPKALWHSVFPDEDLIGSYSRKKATYYLDPEYATPDRIQRIHNIYGFYLNTVMSNRVVDKYPELIFRIDFLKRIFPDFKALFIYRNGWDTCLSSANWSEVKGERKQGEIHDWWGVNNRKWHLLVDELVPQDDDLKMHYTEIKAFTNQVDMSIVEWIISMKKGLEMMAKFPQHIVPVRYEDLVAQPIATLDAIRNFCHLPSDTALNAYALQTLKPVPSKKPIPLNPILEKTFLKLMQQLNY
jgi:hypothetical protein